MPQEYIACSRKDSHCILQTQTSDLAFLFIYLILSWSWKLSQYQNFPVKLNTGLKETIWTLFFLSWVSNSEQQQTI